MSNVQVNSVIISASEYREVLSTTFMAAEVLQKAKSAMIVEWRNDTVARAADLDRIVLVAFAADHALDYSDHLAEIVHNRKRKLKWYERLIGKKLVVTDQFGSLIDFAASKRNLSFAEYRNNFLSGLQTDHASAIIDLGKDYSTVESLIENEWDETVEDLLATVRTLETGNEAVENGALQAQFVIPRGVFNSYTGMIEDASNGNFEPIGELYVNRQFRVDPEYYTPSGY